jgi:hypothetical protein
MQIQSDPVSISARAAAKAIGLHVAPWLDAAAVAACVIKAEKHRALLSLRGKWESDGSPAAGRAAVESALSDYMAAAAVCSVESARCINL